VKFHDGSVELSGPPILSNVLTPNSHLSSSIVSVTSCEMLDLLILNTASVSQCELEMVTLQENTKKRLGD